MNLFDGLFSMFSKHGMLQKWRKWTMQDEKGGLQILFHVIWIADSLRNPVSECDLKPW
jgi:hypothetical protein